MKTLLPLLLLSVTAVSAWDFISKNCCEPHDDMHLGRICDDGSRAPLFGCCGKGPCNIVCCNCDGECITGNHKPFKFLGVWGAGINPNLGMSGGSDASKATKLVKDLVKNTVIDGGKAAVAIGTTDTKQEETEIEYIPRNWG